jgi:hypothetical protein
VHPPAFAALFLALLQAPHRDERGAPRRLRRQAPGEVGVDQLLEVALQLFVQLLVERSAAEERPHAHREHVCPTIERHGVTSSRMD